MNSTYDFTLKEGPKVVIENFIRIKSLWKILEKLKRKVDIFIKTKNIFNLKGKEVESTVGSYFFLF